MSAQPDKIEPWVWRIALTVTVGSLMVGIDSTIINVALSSLGKGLHTTIAQTQWVITGYLLSLAAVIPVAGWAGRRFGPKRVYLLSLVAFTAGSVLCGLSTSITELTIFRVVQGMGGGVLLPIGQLMVASAAGSRRMGRVMSMTSVPLMLSPLIGPSIGGLVIETLSWRWIFYINVPVGVVAFVAGLRNLPNVERQPAGPLDVVGLALLATGMPAITYGLAEIGSTGGVTSPKVWGSILVGTVLTIAFVFHALRIERPLLDMRLYANKTFAAASLTTFCLSAGLFGQQILLPLYYQDVRGFSVLETGLLVGFGGIAAALTMPLAGKLTDRHGAGRLALIGVVFTCIATIPLTFVGPDTSVVFLSAALFCRGLGAGFGFIPAMAVALRSVRPDQLPDATPQMNVLQRIGGSTGVAIVAVALQRALTSAGPHANPALLAGAFSTAFWWALALAVAAIIPALVLIRTERNVGTRQAASVEPVTLESA